MILLLESTPSTLSCCVGVLRRRCERSNWCLSFRWYVLDAETTDLVAIHTDGNEQLSVMRFSQGELSCLSMSTVTAGGQNYTFQNSPLLSADGSLLAVGSHDNFIYLYTVSERGRKYSRYGKCTVSAAISSTCTLDTGTSRLPI